MTDEQMKQRFFRKVAVHQTTGCWLWMGGLTNKGYAVAPRGKRGSHYSLELHGRPRPEGKIALHSCDNPRCVNPDHLRWGTDLENAADRAARKRVNALKGEAKPNSILTEEVVRTILSDPRGYRKLGQALNVDPTAIRNVRKGRTWSHVTGITA